MQSQPTHEFDFVLEHLAENEVNSDLKNRSEPKSEDEMKRTEI